MSMREEGYGLEAVPPHKFQSDFASQSTNETLPADLVWSDDQHQLSEEPNMSSGATKPTGLGQRSIFGGWHQARIRADAVLHAGDARR